jgi:signal transduction histidine kinase
VATAAAALSVAGTIAAVMLHRGNAGTPGVDRFWIGDIIVGALYPLVGAFLVRRRPDNAVGWVLTGTALIGIYAVGGQWFVRAELVVGRPLPLSDLGGWVNAWAWMPHLLLPSLVPLLFPDGRLASPRWRVVLAIVLGGAALVTVVGMLAPIPLDASQQLTNPWAVLSAELAQPAIGVGLVACFAIGSPLALLSVVLRFRRAGRAERQQLLWLLVGGLLLILSLFVQSVLPAGVEDLAWSVGLIGALAAIAVAVLRSGVFDVDLVLNRTLVTLILAGLVFVAYLAAVALLGQFELSDRVTVGLVAMISLLAVSAYDAVQRLVNRLLLAGAADPYAVVLRVGGRLDQASSPADALATLVEELRDALRLPYVAIRATVGDLPPLASGAPPDTALSEFPITNQGAKVGTLHVGQRRTQGGRFAPEERTLLEDVCRRAGALVQAAVLVADLQRSRERIVAAREEERRRLRHDLHDGVGPRLAGMALQLDSLTDRLAHDPELAARAERIRELMRATLAEVRQVVDALRPPALDELGLVGALTEQLSAFAVDDAPDRPGTRARIEAADDLPPLPAAVEVAVYRIVVEAATNAVRHGRAQHLDVRLTEEPSGLTVEIADDGTGIPAAVTPGVGLTSMRERATEVGGALDVLVRPAGGTLIRARIPLQRRPADVSLEPA